MKKIAEKIVEVLEEKKALRENLPFHLDKDKFHHCLENDILDVLKSNGVDDISLELSGAKQKIEVMEQIIENNDPAAKGIYSQCRNMTLKEIGAYHKELEKNA